MMIQRRNLDLKSLKSDLKNCITWIDWIYSDSIVYTVICLKSRHKNDYIDFKAKVGANDDWIIRFDAISTKRNNHKRWRVDLSDLNDLDDSHGGSFSRL